jgi:hypothetical protein
LSSLSLSLSSTGGFVEIVTRSPNPRRLGLDGSSIAQARIFEQVYEYAIDIIIHGAQYLDTF